MNKPSRTARTIKSKKTTVKSAKPARTERATATQVVGKSQIHDSAQQHVTGEAIYIDDINPAHCLHLALATSPLAHAKINHINTEKAQQAKGVIGVFTAQDIGNLLIGPVIEDEPLLAFDEILFQGQAIAVVVADSHNNARRAAKQVEADLTPLDAIISIEQAKQQNSYLLPKPLELQRGNIEQALKQATHKLSGQLELGGQEHYYLETQASIAFAGEDDNITVHCSTQNPTEVQHLIAHTLNLPMSAIEIITRRMGGGFGGKETDSAQAACLSALFAKRFKRPVKCRLSRTDDILLTGKRHNFAFDYQVAFNEQGKIQGLLVDMYACCGYSLDLSKAIVSRALLHADNAYYLPHIKVHGFLCKTHTTSNTAFRGFGGPQGMFVIESIIQDIAHYLNQDALNIRRINYYDPSDNAKNITHYGQKITENVIADLTNQLTKTANYQQRQKNIDTFNKQSPLLKKGLALSPVKFGISFSTQFLNQAGALVHIYKDGSIYLNHGGTEMGQGLFTKIAQIVAEQFGVPLSHIKISATSTAKTPNTSATAASSGSDMNGMAALNACQRIKKNLFQFASEHFQVPFKQLFFADGQLKVANRQQAIPFNELINLAYLNRVELFSNGFYKTPKIHFDEATKTGRPFYYFAHGVAISEVTIDCLTGEYKVNRVDILHDVGHSLNPAIDKGQITGGFIQGMGWLTQEQLSWNQQGRLMTTGASTYKIPTLFDIPKIFNVSLQETTGNPEATIYRSKAVGEPPFMLAISVWLAIKEAIRAAKNTQPNPTQQGKNHKANKSSKTKKENQTIIKLSAPATFETVLQQLMPELTAKP